MKNISLIFLAIFFIHFSSLAQVSIEWDKSFGETEQNIGKCVKQTIDGGYIIMGSKDDIDASKYYFWIIKTDSNGDTLWTKSPNDGNNDIGYYIHQTTDSGYIIVGSRLIEEFGKRDVLLLKTDSFGNTLWTKTFRGNDWNEGKSVQQTIDGGYIILGGSGGDKWSSDVLLIKTDSSGNILWLKTFGGNNHDIGNSIQQTTDGGFILVGKVNGVGMVPRGDGLLMKTDVNGDTLWTKTFAGGTWTDFGEVKQTNDGGYVIIGTRMSSSNADDALFIKTDSLGNTEWSKTFGGNSGDTGASIQQTIDGGYIITGITGSFGAGAADVWLIRTDTLGDTLWTVTFGETSYEHGYSVQQTTDGGYIIAGANWFSGVFNGDVWLIKTSIDPVNVKKGETTLISDYQLVQNYPNP
ncbi:MAG: hypothetical protein JSW63_11415, partial [Ignavibacterium sp.]